MFLRVKGPTDEIQQLQSHLLFFILRFAFPDSLLQTDGVTVGSLMCCL